MYLEILLCMVILIYFTRNREGFRRPSQSFAERLPENNPFRIRMEIIRQQQRAHKKRERLEKLELEARLKSEHEEREVREERLGILISKQKITL